jgi:hypothetical protein
MFASPHGRARQAKAGVRDLVVFPWACRDRVTFLPVTKSLSLSTTIAIEASTLLRGS